MTVSVSATLKEYVHQHMQSLDENCPYCDRKMVLWQNQRKICLNCAKRKIEYEKIELARSHSKKSFYAQSISYFKAFSVFANQEDAMTKTLDRFQEVDQLTVDALKEAERYIQMCLLGEPFTAILTGKPGVGKTHLALGILFEVMKQSTDKRVFFIDIARYNKLKIESFDFFDLKQKVRDIQRQMELADLIVIDDLGSEVGGFEQNLFKSNRHKASNFEIETITNILNSRGSKPLIITTNLTASQIRSVYGDRVLSRVMHRLRFLNFNETTDKRMQFLQSHEKEHENETSCEI